MGCNCSKKNSDFKKSVSAKLETGMNDRVKKTVVPSETTLRLLNIPEQFLTRNEKRLRGIAERSIKLLKRIEKRNLKTGNK